MTELMAADGEVILSDSNKRKLVDTNNILVKRCKTESPTTTAAFTDDEQSTSEHLSDIADDEQSDASEQNEKPSTSSTTTHRPIEMHKKRDAAETILNPQYGQLVNRREFRRAGPYIIGQEIGHSPVDSIVQYLAKKENTNTFVQLKVRPLCTIKRRKRKIKKINNRMQRMKQYCINIAQFHSNIVEHDKSLVAIVFIE